MAGVADAVRAKGIACFGPSGAAAELEGSKAFAKEVMAAAGVPTDASRAGGTPAEVGRRAGRVRPAVCGEGRRARRRQGRRRHRGPRRRVAHAADRDRVVIEEYLGRPRGLAVRADRRGRRPCRSCPPRTSSASATATPGRTPAAWGPTLRCLGAGSLTDEIVADVVAPDAGRDRRRGTPFAGLLYVGLALTSGPPGRRVQRPVRRPRDAGGARAAGHPAGRPAARRRDRHLADGSAARWRDGSAVTSCWPPPGYPAARPATRSAARPGRRHRARRNAAGATGRLVAAGGRVLCMRRHRGRTAHRPPRGVRAMLPRLAGRGHRPHGHRQGRGGRGPDRAPRTDPGGGRHRCRPSRPLRGAGAGGGGIACRLRRAADEYAARRGMGPPAPDRRACCVRPDRHHGRRPVRRRPWSCSGLRRLAAGCPPWRARTRTFSASVCGDRVLAGPSAGTGRGGGEAAWRPGTRTGSAVLARRISAGGSSGTGGQPRRRSPSCRPRRRSALRDFCDLVGRVRRPGELRLGHHRAREEPVAERRRRRCRGCSSPCPKCGR